MIGKLPAVAVNKLGPGYHHDGGGLILQVTATGARTWIFRFDLKGRRREMGLGPTHTIGLAQAREAARQARLLLMEGIDPIEARNAIRKQRELEQATALTFGQCCERYIESQKASWKNAKSASQWTNTLATYCAKLQDRPVAQVTRDDVLECLNAIWTDKQETASRLRGRIESVLDWATVQGYREGENPARWKGNLSLLLPTISKTRRVQHHKAVPWSEVRNFMTRLREEPGIASRALEFVILTACRSGEARLATWDEIDLEKRLWTIPAARMKMSREHRVPLSTQALEVLKTVPRIVGTNLVFPSNRGHKTLSDMALTAVMRRMDVDAVPHGFRSTFRDWAGETTTYPREVCEHALAHKLADGVEAAYQRGDMLKKRQAMMQDWGNYVVANSSRSPSERGGPPNPSMLDDFLISQGKAPLQR